jgi:hypothetical protein
MTVNDSSIEVYNGILPPDYEFSVGAETMMECPWVLGIIGNCRATNVLQNGTAYYNNTHIKAQGWGALSTDGVQKVRLYASNCLIETVDSGYGAYSIGDCLVQLSGCTFNVTDIGMIMANEVANGVFTDGTVVNSGRFGVMMHNGNFGTLTIDKGSIFNTEAAVIQLKSSYPNIVVDNAKLNSKNGIIIQALVNDDPFMAAGRPAGPDVNAPDSSGAPESAPRDSGPVDKPTTRDITATFKNVNLNGDIINSMTPLAGMKIRFEKATITGAITTASVEHVLGPNGEEVNMDHPELYYLIGEVINTYCAMPDDPHGLTVTLDAGSKWVVDKTSYLTNLTIAEDSSVTAPEGSNVIMTVNDVKTPIRAGSYKGKIVLIVNKTI